MIICESATTKTDPIIQYNDFLPVALTMRRPQP